MHCRPTKHAARQPDTSCGPSNRLSCGDHHDEDLLSRPGDRKQNMLAPRRAHSQLATPPATPLHQASQEQRQRRDKQQQQQRQQREESHRRRAPADTLELRSRDWPENHSGPLGSLRHARQRGRWWTTASGYDLRTCGCWSCWRGRSAGAARCYSLALRRRYSWRHCSWCSARCRGPIRPLLLRSCERRAPEAGGIARARMQCRTPAPPSVVR